MKRNEGFNLLLICLAFAVLAPFATAQTNSLILQFGTAADDFAFGVASNGTGAYIAGYSGAPTSLNLPCTTHYAGSNALIAKFDPVSMLSTLASPASGAAQAVAVDSTGAAYTVGTDTTLNEAFLSKYNSSGTLQWTQDIPVAYASYGFGVALDGAGGVYVAGYALVGLPPNEYNGFLNKYDVNGNLLWSSQLGTLYNVFVTSVATDSTGVYVAGFTNGVLEGSNAGGYDVFVSKFPLTGGTAIWTQQFGSSADDLAFGITTDSTGVYVAGYTDGALPAQTSSGLNDAFLGQFDASGNSIWLRQFGTSSDDFALGVSVNSGIAYVSGYTGGLLGQQAFGGSDAFVRAYDTKLGAALWTDQFGTSSDDLAWGVAAAAGGIYAVGCTTGTFPLQNNAGGSDAFLAMISGPMLVSIDIKPGSYPNSINLGNNGVVPVAIFSTPTFDATKIDPATVTLAGANVALKGKGTLQYSFQDVNHDGLMDMVVQVTTSALQLSNGDTFAVLTGSTYAPVQQVIGVDTVRIVP